MKSTIDHSAHARAFGVEIFEGEEERHLLAEVRPELRDVPLVVEEPVSPGGEVRDARDALVDRPPRPRDDRDLALP